MRADKLPAMASPRGRNSLLVYLAADHAIAAKRPGFEIQNASPVTGRPAVLGQFDYVRRVAGTLTSSHLLVTDGGRLDVLSAGVVSAFDAATPTPFTSGEKIPSFAAMNNLAFVVNGTDKKKLNNTSVQTFGITRPSAPTVVDSGVAGTPNGTYEVAISYRNSSTGHQSSRSNTTSITVASKKFDVSWAAPGDTQVDEVVIHIRKGTVLSEFFQLIVGVTPGVNANGAFAVATASVRVDVSDAQLTALLILSPDTAENDPPPSSLVSVAAHLSRLFVLDKTQLYYSKPKFPEAFDPEAFEPVNPNDGQDNVTLFVAFGVLLIFKSGSFYALKGTDPNSWYIEVVDPEIGCIAPASIFYHDGKLYWWSKLGPVVWDGSGSPALIGQNLIGPTISRDVLNHDRLNTIVGAPDAELHLGLFAVPQSGETRNSLMLPFNTRNQTWHSDGWTPFDAASLAVVKDANGKPWIYAGNYGGRVFKFAVGDVDGALLVDGSSNALTLEGNVTAATTTTLTDSGANFDIAGDGLKELYVYAVDPDGGVQRRRITANTGTQLTITPDWEAVPDTNFTYVIASPDWEWDTRWEDGGAPFVKKRGLFALIQALSESGQATVRVDVFKDYNPWTSIKSFDVVASGSGGIWDVSEWDSAIFGEEGVTYKRNRVGKTFRAYRLRFSNLSPNTKVAIIRGGMSWSKLSEKT